MKPHILRILCEKSLRNAQDNTHIPPLSKSFFRIIYAKICDFCYVNINNVEQLNEDKD